MGRAIEAYCEAGGLSSFHWERFFFNKLEFCYAIGCETG
jgi:hypothetical protein